MMKVVYSSLVGLGFALVALGQTKPPGQIKALSHAIHAVDDLDTTLALYRDVFGLHGKAADFPNAAGSL